MSSPDLGLCHSVQSCRGEAWHQLSSHYELSVESGLSRSEDMAVARSPHLKWCHDDVILVSEWGQKGAQYEDILWSSGLQNPTQ